MRGKKVIEFLGKTKATIFLTVFLVGFFFFLSNDGFFLLEETADALAFGFSQPQNILTHLFVHTSYDHLIANAVALLIFGSILEIAVGSIDFLAIFVLSGVLSATVFLLIGPFYVLLGASAAISGIIAGAFAAKPKKFVFALIAMFAFSFLLINASEFSILETSKSLSIQKSEAGEELEKAVESGDIVKQGEASEEIKTIEAEQKKLKEGRRFQGETIISPVPHLLGAFFGLAFLWILRKEKLEEGKKEAKEIIKKLMKKK